MCLMAFASAMAPDFPASAGRCGSQGSGSTGGSLLLSGAGNRLDLGQAHVGHMVGLGCTFDLDVRVDASLSRLHGGVAGF